MSSDRNSRVMPPPRAANNTGTTTASTTASATASTTASATTRPAGSSQGPTEKGGVRSQRAGPAPCKEEEGFKMCYHTGWRDERCLVALNDRDRLREEKRRDIEIKLRSEGSPLTEILLKLIQSFYF